MSKDVFTHLVLCIAAGTLLVTGNLDDYHFHVSTGDAFMELIANNTSNLIHKKQCGCSSENRDANTPGSDYPLSSHYNNTNESELLEKEVLPVQNLIITGKSNQDLRWPDFSGALKPVYSNPFYDLILTSLTTIVLLH